MSVFTQRIAGLGEGVTIALDSIRANKVRAGLTILASPSACSSSW
jgi:hypothetical protein